MLVVQLKIFPLFKKPIGISSFRHQQEVVFFFVFCQRWVELRKMCQVSCGLMQD